MKPLIFDSHAHYDDRQFDDDRDALLASMPQNGVELILNAATSPASVKQSIAMAERYPFVYAAVGVHPSELDTADLSFVDELASLYTHEKVVAIGEIGLDYHYDTFPRERQRAWFERQLALAKTLDAPVIVHDRDAHEDTLTLLKQYQPRGVVHCFSGSVEMMQEIVKLGMYIGLGGAVTFKNAKKPCAVAAAVDGDKLLLETDCPYMAPVPLRGHRCDSAQIIHTAEKIAELRGVTVDDLLWQTNRNAKTLFGIG